MQRSRQEGGRPGELRGVALSSGDGWGLWHGCAQVQYLCAELRSVPGDRKLLGMEVPTIDADVSFLELCPQWYGVLG